MESTKDIGVNQLKIALATTSLPQILLKPTFEEFLRKETKRAISQNDKDVIKGAEQRDVDLIKRIENHRHEKLTDEEEQVQTIDWYLDRIRSDPIARALFRKDTVRQNIHENTQIAWIQNFYPDAIKLPAAKGGIYLSKFKMMKIHPRPSDATKTLDISIPSMNIYGVLKYSKTEGGAQDNQFRDVKHFIDQMIGYLNATPDAKESFYCYLDGPYYSDKGYKRHKELQDMIPQPWKNRMIITGASLMV